MTAQLLAATPDGIEQAGKLLRAGEVVGAPTETVYGLAALARDERALAKVFAVKERPTFDPLIVHVEPPPNESKLAIDFDWLAYLAECEIIDGGQLTAKQSLVAGKLAGAFWPGPLTLVLPKHASIPDLATSGLSTVAVRAPARLAMQRLIRAAGGPLAAPSANLFGGISPTSAQAVLEELGDRIPLILDDGPCEIGLESTVLAVSNTGETSLLRPGGLAVERIEQCLGDQVVEYAGPIASSGAELAPGRLPSHYAPRKPLTMLPAPLAELTSAQIAAMPEFAGGGVGLLAIAGDPADHASKLAALLGPLGWPPPAVIRSLSVAGDWSEAARNLFCALRALDAHPATVLLLAEPVPSRQSSQGLSHAIADRLGRASAKISSSRLENPSTSG